jgi:surfeit locus 1 family protein
VTTRFWLRPRWVVGHILCLVLIVLFVNLGFWQLRRLEEKRDRNDLIHARERATPTSVADALAGGADDGAYRLVRDRGRWDVEATVLVRSRALNQQAGYDVLTPLETEDGTTVVVNRGFAPNGTGGEPAILRAARPTDREVEVEGILRTSEARGRFGPKDRSGPQRVVNRIDLGLLQAQSDRPLAPLYLQLTASEPPQPPPRAVPIARPLPTTDEGPHLAYAVQWFIFATVGAVGWPLLLRKTARDEGADPDEADTTD